MEYLPRPRGESVTARATHAGTCGSRELRRWQHCRFRCLLICGTNRLLPCWGFILPYLFGTYWLAPTFSMTQGLVGVRMRPRVRNTPVRDQHLWHGHRSAVHRDPFGRFPGDDGSWRGFVALGVGGQPRIQLVCGNSVLVCGPNLREDLAAAKELG